MKEMTEEEKKKEKEARDRFKNLGFVGSVVFKGKRDYDNYSNNLYIQFNEEKSEIIAILYEVNNPWLFEAKELKSFLHLISVTEDSLLAQGYSFAKSYRFASKASEKRNRSEHNRAERGQEK